ncbi:hypothetical protein INS49_013579 [Diaporthe citri]|uniref:uncharacterized protein n=1 Tax=Diaporthe citri TaxID=83186 RepID=UPI001C7F0FD4|nr:uncharacterized protein INS49_013579 [Diaporthe citri]KAG6357700.1 hypothetical protein INS49_013579 [Diaporthe citri]
MVGNQKTEVTFMIYDGGDGVDVPILAYAADNDTLLFQIQYHPSAAASNLAARTSGTQANQSHAPFFAANGAGIKLSMQSVVDRKRPSAFQADATGSSKAVVNDWFHKRKEVTYVGYEEVFITDNGLGGAVLCYVSRPKLGLLPLDTDFL